MSEGGRGNPISPLALFQNFWVFVLYGVALVAVLRVGGQAPEQLKRMQDLMIEPMSFYCYTFLTAVGLFLLLIASVTFAKAEGALNESWCVRNLFVPVLNAGLSSGAIVSGMLLGLAIGLAFISRQFPEFRSTAQICFVAFLVAAPEVIGFMFLSRSLFGSARWEKRLKIGLGLTFYLALASAAWFFNRPIFWSMNLLTFGIGTAVCAFLEWGAKKRGSTIFRLGRVKNV